MNKPVDALRTRRHFLRVSTAAVLGATCSPMLMEAADVPESAATKPARIQVGVLLGTFSRPTLEGRLDAAKACGMESVQVNMACAGLPTMPDSLPAGLAGRIRREVAARGLALGALEGTFNMSHPEASQREKGLRQLRVLAEACGEMGTLHIHLCTGTRDRSNMWRRHPDNNTPEAWRDLVSCMREAANIAQQTGVILAFEPEVNNVVDSAQKARRLMDEVGSAHLKVTIDPANIFHKGELPRMSEMLDEAFTLLGKDIALAHAKDLDHDGDAGHLAAGKGKLDYDRYVALLKKYNFKGPIFLHGLSEAQAPGCVAFLKQKLARA